MLANDFPAATGLIHHDIGELTTKTSRNVNFCSQSRFNVSTQTAPVASSTFGCQIRVLKLAFGGLLG
jgi:hypothetical protein